MKTPPLLLGAALVLWGWQTDFLAVGMLLAVAIEGARVVRVRWDLSDEDFTRVWTFCSLLALASLVYAFTSNEGFLEMRGILADPRLLLRRSAGAATSHSAAAFFRWFPMILFLIVAAQAWSAKGAVPLATMQPFLRRRMKKARKAGRPLPFSPTVDLCTHSSAFACFRRVFIPARRRVIFGAWYFLWGWMLWPQRSRRFGLGVWVILLAVAVVAGYEGQRSILPVQAMLTNYNPQWLWHFSGRASDPNSNKTAIGTIGRLKTSNRIAVRVEVPDGSSPPDYLREATYRLYRPGAATWLSLMKEGMEQVGAEKGAGESFVLVPGKTNANTVNIACYLTGGEGSIHEGILPLPEGSGRLDNLPAYGLRDNALGTVVAEGPGLVLFDARYGPGPVMDAPTNAEDYQVPQDLGPAIRRIVAQLQLNRVSEEEALHRVRRFFADNFTYSTWEKTLSSSFDSQTALPRFLLTTHTGHCEYFATATVLLLRQAGIPARYAVGFAMPPPTGSRYLVRERDAHAWCLVWKDGAWRDFDTTPANWRELEPQQSAMWLRLSDLASDVWFEISKFRWGQSHVREYLLIFLLPVLALLLLRIIAQKWRKQRRLGGIGGPAPIWPGLDSEFYRLEKKLGEHGIRRGVSEPLSAWLARAASEDLSSTQIVTLNQLLELHYRYRFDPLGLDSAGREALREGVLACIASLGSTPVPAE